MEEVDVSMPRSKGTKGHNYTLLPELDSAIIACLPREGAKMGWHPLAKQVRAITKELNQIAPTRSSEINSRVRALLAHEFIVGVPVTPLNGGSGYQRTEKGEKFARENGALTQTNGSKAAETKG